jgi:predicted transcriptional regulator
MTRTQIYLDDDQKAALRLLAANRQSTVSDLVREAVDRLLEVEFQGVDFGTRFTDVQARLQARIGDRSDTEVDAAFKKARLRRRQHTAV